MKKIIYLFTFSICLALTACVADDPTIADEEGALLVSTPDAGGEANIITPCDPVANEHCEDDNPGGSGPGGGGVGGGTGGGSGGGGGTPPGMTCPSGWHYESLFGYCVNNQWGQHCFGGVFSRLSNEHCYFTQSGVCSTWQAGGDCRCDYGHYRGTREGHETYGLCIPNHLPGY